MSRRVAAPPPRHRVVPGAPRIALSTDFVPAFHEDLRTIMEAAYHLRLAYTDVAALAGAHGIEASADTLLSDLEVASAGRAAALAARMGAAARLIKADFGGGQLEQRRREVRAELMAVVVAQKGQATSPATEIPF